MTYNTGTATDYIDLLDQLVEVVTSRHLASIAINAGGTGYEVGEVLDISGTGATSTHTAQIEVTTISGGVITGARVYRGGAYTVDPTTTTANASTSTNLLSDGTAVASADGTGATFDLTFAATGWTQQARQSEVTGTPTVAAAGTGHSVSDVLTLVGGVVAVGGSAATVTVATLSGSGVATVTLTTAGDYEVYPTGNIATTSDGAGIDCTLNATWADVSGDTIVILQGDAGAELDPLIGIKTYSSETDESSVNTVYNWALFGMTSWQNTLPLHQQPNISDGFNSDGLGGITGSTTGDGAFMPLKTSDAFNISWSIRATSRNVTIIAAVEGASTLYDSQASFGLLNQLGTTTEYPYPAYVAASSDRKRVWYRDTSAIWGGLTEVVSRNNGPFFVWAPEGAWIPLKVATISSNTATTPSYSGGGSGARGTIWPLGEGNTHSDGDDQIWGIAATNGFDTDDLTLASSPVEIYRTPDTGGDIFPLLPAFAVQSDSATDKYRVFGMIDGVWWFHVADAAISSGSRHNQDGSFYSVFQNGTRVNPFSFFALRED